MEPARDGDHRQNGSHQLRPAGGENPGLRNLPDQDGRPRRSHLGRFLPHGRPTPDGVRRVQHRWVLHGIGFRHGERSEGAGGGGGRLSPLAGAGLSVDLHYRPAGHAAAARSFVAQPAQLPARAGLVCGRTVDGSAGAQGGLPERVDADAGCRGAFGLWQQQGH